MTPLAFTQTLVDDLVASYPLLPAPPAHAQLGDLVVDCAGVYATILNLTEFAIAGSQHCGYVTLADLSVVAAHDCANVANEDGTTNWQQQDIVSAQMDVDGDMLWEWAEKQRADSYVLTTPPSITYIITGAVAMTTLGLQLPVP